MLKIKTSTSDKTKDKKDGKDMKKVASMKDCKK